MPSIVLLLSDKRSGSTMFQDEICRHPAVQTVPSSPHANLETHWWLMAAVLLQRPDALFSAGQRYGGYGSRANARAYISVLEEQVGTSIDIISTGPDRNETIVLRNPFGE